MKESNDIMRIEEAADFLATCKGALRRWASEGRVPVVRVFTTRMLFRRSDLEKWLAKHKGSTPNNARERRHLCPRTKAKSGRP